MIRNKYGPSPPQVQRELGMDNLQDDGLGKVIRSLFNMVRYGVGAHVPTGRTGKEDGFNMGITCLLS